MTLREVSLTIYTEKWYFVSFFFCGGNIGWRWDFEIFFLKYLGLLFDFIKSFKNPRKFTFNNFYSEIFWNLKYFFVKPQPTVPRLDVFHIKSCWYCSCFEQKTHIMCIHFMQNKTVDCIFSTRESYKKSRQINKNTKNRYEYLE